MNKIACQSPAARAGLFGETADRLDLAASLIEKDFWVCWVLEQIFSSESLSRTCLFKGGTSLSKVFGLINRFSEDIDLVVDYGPLGFVGDRSPTLGGLSKTRQQNLLAEMLEACRQYVSSEFIGTLRTRFNRILGDEAVWNLQVDELDRNIVRFRYPPAVAAQVSYVKPEVVLELGTHAEFVPQGQFEVYSFAAQEFPALFVKPAVKVSSILAKRTFWEKGTILHAEHHRPADKPLPGRYSRHYYDVAMILRTPAGAEALDDLELLAQVVRHKKIFYPAAWARYDLAVPGELKLMPHETRLASLRQDYRGMAVMLFGDPPKFETLVAILADAEQRINAGNTKRTAAPSGKSVRRTAYS